MLGVIFLSAAMQAAGLQVGAGAVDITPPSGVPMAGYYSIRYNQGTHDPLMAKALVFEKDGAKAAVVALDLIHIPAPMVEKARVMIDGLTSVPAAHVMISATHSHTGPEMGSRLRNVDPAAMKKLETWAAQLPNRIAQAVRQAETNLAPMEPNAAIAMEDSVSFIRRFRMTDGSVAWNPGKMNPKIAAPIGTIDPRVTSLFFGQAATYVNFANHLDTVSGLAYSADYAGALSRVVDSAREAGHITLFTLGCAGNINHIDVKRAEPQRGPAEAGRIGAILAGAVLKSQREAKAMPVSGPLRTRRETVALELAPLAATDVAEARDIVARYGTAQASPFYDQVKAFRVLDLEARNGKPLDAEVQVITLGREIAFVGLPGEIFVDLGKQIKAKSPYPMTIVVSLANGALGYIPDRPAYAEGAYEVVSSRVREGSGEKLVDAALRLLAN
ncbi:hypothetical protein F183_A30400 [Bryobacterales bacterium F-183]|nr:hypothetical protein F183_A30400 [Bryobacterales bacterium F-183]